MKSLHPTRRHRGHRGHGGKQKAREGDSSYCYLAGYCNDRNAPPLYPSFAFLCVLCASVLGFDLLALIASAATVTTAPVISSIFRSSSVPSVISVPPCWVETV